jgi:hypothetical protein
VGSSKEGFPLTKFKIMIAKYIIRVNIFESGINGIRNSRNYEYIFEEPNLIESRNKAIEQVKELTSFMTSGTKDKFSTLNDVQLDGTDFFHAFQIDLVFITNDGDEYQIFGEEEFMIYSLMQEADYYKEIDDSVLFRKLYNTIGDEIEVLESNIYFFIN